MGTTCTYANRALANEQPLFQQLIAKTGITEHRKRN